MGLISPLLISRHLYPQPRRVAARATPAAFTFNGTDEALLRTLATSSPGTTIFTYSLWTKVAAYSASNTAYLFQVINVPTNSQFIFGSITNSGSSAKLEQDSSSDDWGEIAITSPNINTGAWHHLVMRYESSNGTADNRLRFYQNGNLLTDNNSPSQPGASEAHRLFTNGRQHQIGAFVDLGSFLSGKLAFIDVVDGQSLDATSFGFDNGGTWTRKKYTGGWGTYGFSLDGTDSFNDVSGNAQHFTGQNMDASNLDTADLPPYTN
jgi:hypothetical protein